MTAVLDTLQTVAILAALGFSIWQWKRTCDTIKIDNYAKIIGAMNDLRTHRLENPEVERALFDSRKDWTDDEIRKRVYGVMFANIFEWTFFSYQEHLIGEKQWKSWETIWKEVILPNDTFAELMSDRTIYTFSFPAHDLIRKWVDEVRAKKGRRDPQGVG
jgi:hypothetical protein